MRSGDSKAITPEGTAGVFISPDGSSTVVRGSDGNWGIWSLAGGSMRPTPDLTSDYSVAGWAPDGNSLYVTKRGRHDKGVELYEANVATGKMKPWKTFGAGGTGSIRLPVFSTDAAAYAYNYSHALSQAYVIKGLQ
jgi:WD40 repeat protein